MNFKILGDKLGLDEDEYRELVDLFLETGRADYELLATAFDAGDARQVAQRAHTINGAAGNMGLLKVHEVAKRIERAAIENQLDSVSTDVETLRERLDSIAGSVRA